MDEEASQLDLNQEKLSREGFIAETTSPCKEGGVNVRDPPPGDPT